MKYPQNHKLGQESQRHNDLKNIACDWLTANYKHKPMDKCFEVNLDPYDFWEHRQRIQLKDELIKSIEDDGVITPQYVSNIVSRRMSLIAPTEYSHNAIPRRFIKLWFETKCIHDKNTGTYKRNYILKTGLLDSFIEKHIEILATGQNTRIWWLNIPKKIHCVVSTKVDKNNKYYGKRLIVDILDDVNKVAIECGLILHHPIDKLSCLSQLGYVSYWLRYDGGLYKYTDGDKHVDDLTKVWSIPEGLSA